MSHFALIFRQSPRKLSEEDQKRRAAEVRAWALRQNSEGRKLDPYILADESQRIGPDGTKSEASEESPVGAIAFCEARDFAEAVRIAETHPGIRYGVTIEVRPWARPPTPKP